MSATTPTAPLPPDGLDTTRPGELGSSAFATLPPMPQVRTPAASFDVCHVGVVLRAVVLVQAIAALGALYAAVDVAGWLLVYARASIVALWAVLSWLLASCLASRALARRRPALQWGFALALGAGCMAASEALMAWVGLLERPAPPPWAGPAAGAAVAAALFHLLQLRARSRAPVEATARLAELQSRIRPHFLFNALNTALALVRVDPARAEAVLEDLAELFRTALSETGESVSLGDEVELARRYLEIEQVRFGARLQVRWDLDSRAHAARVPPLLLQPLVENAVRHGIEPAAQGGSIRVRTRARRHHAVVDIVNTLPGAPSTPGHGMALANVRERLRLMHDVAAQFEARRAGDAFRVQLVVPLPG